MTGFHDRLLLRPYTDRNRAWGGLHPSSVSSCQLQCMKATGCHESVLDKGIEAW